FEYATFDEYVDYTSENKIQQRSNNGGTVLARVIEIGGGKAVLTFSREDYFYRENFLKKASNMGDILLMEPIKVGTTWTLKDGRVKTITGTNVKVETPSGTYMTVAVKTDYGVGNTSINYYAPGIGLVKVLTYGEDFEVSSSLSEIQRDIKLKHTIRFYYPSATDGVLLYKDSEVSFKTNDITRKVLETAYKQLPEGFSGKVFSENTRINSLYLNDDGMVYLDLSNDFVTEMNAGSDYEAMLLQCVANTFGSYYGAERVILTIDNGLYESGHIKLEKGQYLTVKTENSVEIT
ncbi:MAG: GerMN domain-containing protein, partial [Oscillospiraceae bacterium]